MKEMKEVIFGAWRALIWKTSEGVFQGEVVYTDPLEGVDVPPIMLDGIPFMVGPNGLEGRYVRYIFPPLIPRIIAAIK